MKNIQKSLNIKSLGLQINTRLNLKDLTDQVIPKLCATCNPSQTSLVFRCMYLWLLCLHLLGTIWMTVHDDIEVYLLQNMQTPNKNLWTVKENLSHIILYPSKHLRHHYTSHRKSNKMQQCINILFHIYMKLNMFRATHCPSSGAENCTSSLWFCIRGRLLDM
jgi:hypothetical protein